jgi:major vault protein
LYRKTGYYLPTADIEVLDIRKGYILNEMSALHLSATKDFTDVYGIKRRAGDEWIIDRKISDCHIIDSSEVLVKEKRIIVLNLN